VHNINFKVIMHVIVIYKATVNNSFIQLVTYVSTRVSEVYLLRNKLFLVHQLGVKQTEILDVLGRIFSLDVT
jgi:hypothetical protein